MYLVERGFDHRGLLVAGGGLELVAVLLKGLRVLLRHLLEFLSY